MNVNDHAFMFPCTVYNECKCVWFIISVSDNKTNLWHTFEWSGPLVGIHIAKWDHLSNVVSDGCFYKFLENKINFFLGKKYRF